MKGNKSQKSVPIKKNVHFTAQYLLDPTNPIIVDLIGVGGTGSQMLTSLGRINHALIELSHPGLHVNVYDDDVITEANLGRQLFTQSEVGRNKAVALVNRINRFFGTNWKAQPVKFNSANLSQRKEKSNLYISCVDTVDTRFAISSILKGFAYPNGGNRRDRPYYWLDCGNSKTTGQAILSSIGRIEQPKSKKYSPVEILPFITDEFGHLLRQSEVKDNTPSCSLAQALGEQDLFINSNIANMGASLLWQLLRYGVTENRGFFLNLADFHTMPLKVSSKQQVMQLLPQEEAA